jgi:hypothetical protein
MGGAALADELSEVAEVAEDPVAALSARATTSGTTSFGAYSFAPEWSDELGLSATGVLGYTLSDRSAIGLLVTGGERKREALLNFGFEIDGAGQIVVSGGQLREKLEFGLDGDQEWVDQNQFGLGYDTANFAFSLYHVDSESSENFVGAKSTSAEFEGTTALSSLATLDYAAGYQTLDWDDDSEGENGLTARLDLDYQVTPDMLLNAFADHNVSENQFGIGAQWQFGAGTLSANYTRIEGNVGAISDDNRFALMVSMPLGGSNNSGAAVTRGATSGNTGAVVTSSSSLLAEVMRRPDYLPQRVIVKAAGGSGGSACPFTLVDINGVPANNYFPFAPSNYDSFVYLLDPSGLLDEYDGEFTLGEYDLNKSGSAVSTVTNVVSLIAVSDPDNLVALPLVFDGYPECNSNPTSAIFS